VADSKPKAGLIQARPGRRPGRPGRRRAGGAAGQCTLTPPRTGCYDAAQRHRGQARIRLVIQRGNLGAIASGRPELPIDDDPPALEGLAADCTPRRKKAPVRGPGRLAVLLARQHRLDLQEQGHVVALVGQCLNLALQLGHRVGSVGVLVGLVVIGLGGRDYSPS